MNTNHLTDEVIQDYVFHKISDEQFVLHISECTDCKAKIEAYHVLMDTIDSVKPETFPFNITELVLQKIEAMEPKRKTLGNYGLITILSTFILGIILYVLTVIEPINHIFSSLRVIDSAFIIVSALSVFIFLFKDILRQYKQMEMLLLH
jgi:hypothetical protein